MHDFLEWRDNTPVSSHFDDVYYSLDDGLAESRYVFLQQNDLPRRWQQHQTAEFSILETGFGTGLNFIAAWQMWRKTAPENTSLHYISIEKYPLNADQIRRALSPWPELAEQTEHLAAQLPPPLPGWHTLNFNNDRLRLSLIFADIGEALCQLGSSNITADAIFLDGFAPDKNPEMWTDAVLSGLANLASQNTTIASFTAVGRIRRQLQHCGFDMVKIAGFGRKRHMIRGSFNALNNKPLAWYWPDKHQPAPNRVAVIGAGLAGAHTAFRLAQAGVLVDVYDKADHIASQASGNHQGIIFVKLSASDGLLPEFSLASYLHSLRFYRALISSGQLLDADASFCGMLQLCDDTTWFELQQRFAATGDWIDFVDANTASNLAGTMVSSRAIWFKHGGWINPPSLCKALLSHTNIKVHLNANITGLKYRSGHWQLELADTLHEADTVVLANGLNSNHLSQAYQLPIKAAPGQTTLFNATAEHLRLKCVVCHQGYAAPAYKDLMSIGASFRMKHASLKPLAADDQLNIDNFKAALPELPLPEQLQSRVAVRAASSDYLPIAGPIPNSAEFAQRFKHWRSDAKTAIRSAGDYLPGLYTLTGLGSRGLSYAPLCADIVCDQILNRNQSVSPTIYEALQPARFLVRGLKRNNTDALY